MKSLLQQLIKEWMVSIAEPSTHTFTDVSVKQAVMDEQLHRIEQQDRLSISPPYKPFL